MTNKEFLIEVQKSCHLDVTQCLSLTDSLQKMLGKAGVDQIPVKLNGLGVFVAHKHPEYIQEDTQTGAMTLYPPRISYRMCTDEVEDAVSASLLLSEYAKVSEESAKLFLDALVSVINQHLLEEDEVEVPEIGIFRNVKTHQSDLQHLSFSPDPKLKDLVNTPFSCFEPFVISEGKVKGKNEYSTVDDKDLEIPVEETENSILDDTQESINEPTVKINIEETNIMPVEENIDPVKETIVPVVENNIPIEEENIPIEEGKISSEEEKVPAEEEIISVEEKNLPIEIKNKNNPVVKKQEDNSYNYVFYTSLALILLGCGFLSWLIFSDNIFSSDEHLEEAVLAEPMVKTPMVLPDSLEETNDTLSVTTDSLVNIKDNENITSKSEIVSEPEIAPKPEIVQKTEIDKKTEIATKPEVASKPEVKEFHRLLNADGKPKTVTLQPGERLTLLALSHFGDKAFWPYIFEVNKDKLKAPNMVQAGMKLYLPDPEYYHIDVNNPESLRKAKNLGVQLLK